MTTIDSFEKTHVDIFPDANIGSKALADEIAVLIKSKASKNEHCVLGLATGSTPKILYKELVRLHKEEGLSFKNVICFNLDEYYPMQPDAKQSYHRFMADQLFSHIDIDPKNIHIPDGTIQKANINSYTESFENKIKESGGIDIQVLGIGLNGHIGFNEPGANRSSVTRIVALETNTRLANAYEFNNVSEVPRLAITMGISTIFKSQAHCAIGFWSNQSRHRSTICGRSFM